MKKRVLFLIETLGSGGAERVLVNLVNAMDKSKFNVTVNTLFGGGVNVRMLDASVEYEDLGYRQFPGISHIMYLIPSKLLFNHYVKNKDYDIIISYMHGVTALISAAAPTIKIVWVHSEFMERGRHFLKYFALRRCYDRFDRIVAVSQRVSKSVVRNLGCKKQPITIYNTNDVARIKKLAADNLAAKKVKENQQGIVLVTVGCLESTKGYDRLIHVCSKLNEEFRFTLLILGEGRDHEKLSQMIESYKLEDSIRLMGFQENPYQFVEMADLFVCSSRQEGLSTAVTEAIILGKPVVSTDVSGAREILGEHNEYGIVVENSEAGIYDGIKQFLTNREKLEEYRLKAQERAAFFDTQRCVRQVEDLFERVLKRSVE